MSVFSAIYGVGLTKRLALLVVSVLLSQPLLADHQTYRIGLFTTRSAGDAYWGPVEHFMRAACHDLGMELEVFYADGNHIELVKQFEAAASGGLFDALVLPNFKKTAHRNIKTAESHQVPVLLFNSGISAERKQELGRPREKYRFWIGSILPNEQQAGFDLLNWLLLAANYPQAKGPASAPLVAVGGNLADFASIERIRGLEQAIEKQDRVHLAQLVHADWQRGRAAAMFRHLIKRYPEVRVVWAASDLMALGVLDSAAAAGVSVVAGGVDWTVEGLRSVLNGGLKVSFGGHFMDGGWAAVMLYDYFHGVDFAKESLSLVTPMEPLSIEDKELIEMLLRARDWERVDFRVFSKVLNPKLEQYPFAPRSVFAQLP